MFSEGHGRRSRRNKQARTASFGRAAHLRPALALESLEDRALLAAQLIASDVTTRTVTAGETIQIPVTYQTLDDSGNPAALGANLISFNLHFDDTKLTYVETTNENFEDIVVRANSVRDESEVTGSDNALTGGAATNKVLTAAYSDNPAVVAGWPNAPATTPLQLYIATFTVNAGFSGSTTVNFSANDTGNVQGQAAQFEFDSRALTLSSGAANTDPVINSAASASVPENQTTAIDVDATDGDSDTLTYALSGGADAALFNINSSSGVVTFKAAPDFEAPADNGANNVYDFQVTVTDGNGGSAVQNIAVTVTDVNEQANRAPVINSSATASVQENQTSAIDVNATDEDGDSIDYSITGGADAALFNIVTDTGVVTFKAAPDFEAPTDSGGTNVYAITVTAADVNGGSDVQNIAITVTNVVEQANRNPTINSAAAASVAENQLSAIDVNATDLDGDTLSYAISGGADADDFNIVAATGVVTFKSAPDFEIPGDTGGDNVYNLDVTVTDGNGGSAVQSIAITVTDIDETSNGILQGRKFSDLNADGVRDANEPWLNGWTILLVNSAGTIVDQQVTGDVDFNGDNVIDPATEMGWFRFSATPGTYTLDEVAQDGWKQTAPASRLAALAFSLDSQLEFRETSNDWRNWGGLDETWFLGANSWYYVTPDGSLYAWDGSARDNLSGTLVETFSPEYHENPSLLYDAEPAVSPTFTVVANQTLPNVNFGNFNIGNTGSIHGRKFNDLNGDGQRSDNEEWLNGWTIELLNADGAVVGSTVTMDMDLNGDNVITPATESGWYWFNDVAPGQWSVREVVQAGWEQTTPADAVAAEAFKLDNDLNLRFSRSLFPNWGGLNERWMLGDDNWYYVTPDGAFYEWNGSERSNLSGTQVGQLSPEYHADPSLIYNALNPAWFNVQVDPGQTVEGLNFGNRQTDGGGPTTGFDGQGNVRARVAGNHLILTGDNAGNGVSVYLNNDGFVTVAGMGNTTIEGQSSPWVIDGWTSIPGDVRASLKGGDDALAIRDVSIGRNATVRLDAGNDYFLTDNISVARNLDVRASSGDNTILVQNSSVGNLARVVTGNGNDGIFGDGITVNGKTSISTRGGNDVFAIRDSSHAGNASVSMGSGDDQVVLAGANSLGGKVTADGNSGTDAVDVDDATTFASEPNVRRFEQDFVADVDGLLDQLMTRLANVGLDGLLSAN